MIDFLRLWDESSDQYHRYSLGYPQYKKTNEKIVELAHLEPSQTVVDLACGTGVTTREILKQAPEVAKIYALDFSLNMIQTARDIVKSDKVTCILSEARRGRDVVDGRVDRVVCNAAFWQFPNKQKVLESVADVLRPDGRFVFNLNQQFFDLGEADYGQKKIIKTIFSELKNRGYQQENKLVERLSMEEIESLVERSGLVIEKIETIDIGPRPLDDFLYFFTIPATATFFDGVSEKEQKEILAAVHERLEDKILEIEYNRWIYFVLRGGDFLTRYKGTR